MASRSPSISRALTAALRSAQVAPREEATAALARRYAALIEDAEKVAAELAGLKAEDESTAAALARLRAKVEAQAVAADLGPKLLAALAALGMTRAAVAAPPKGGAQDGPGGSLAGFRAKRARLRDASAVDSAAP